MKNAIMLANVADGCVDYDVTIQLSKLVKGRQLQASSQQVGSMQAEIEQLRQEYIKEQARLKINRTTGIVNDQNFSFDDYYSELSGNELPSEINPEKNEDRTEIFKRENLVGKLKELSVEIQDKASGSVEEVQNVRNLRLFLVGPAGTGKTTLLDYVVYKWAQEDPGLRKYNWVFKIDCRYFNGDTSDSIEDVIIDLCFKGQDLSSLRVELIRYLQLRFEEKKESNQILLILDGVDEIPGSSTADSKDRAGGRAIQIIENAIDRFSVNPCIDLIVSSRSHMVFANLGLQLDDLLKQNFRIIEMQGFSRRGVQEYLDYYFTPKSQYVDVRSGKQMLEKLIAKNPSLSVICRIPAMLDGVCQSWLELTQTAALREGNIFDVDCIKVILTHLLLRYASKFTPEKFKLELAGLLDEQVYERFYQKLLFLEHFAIVSFINNSLVVNAKSTIRYLQELFPEENTYWWVYSQFQLGLLVGAGSVFSVMGEGEQLIATKGYEITHILFRDFFVAQFLVKCMRQESLHNFEKAIKHACALSRQAVFETIDHLIIERVIKAPQQRGSVLDFMKQLLSSERDKALLTNLITWESQYAALLPPGLSYLRISPRSRSPISQPQGSPSLRIRPSSPSTRSPQPSSPAILSASESSSSDSPGVAESPAQSSRTERPVSPGAGAVLQIKSSPVFSRIPSPAPSVSASSSLSAPKVVTNKK